MSKSIDDPMTSRWAIEGALFDCDGTLLDSLNAWQGLESVLDEEAGSRSTPEERALFATYTIEEVARYFHEKRGLFASTNAVESLMVEYMLDYYRHHAQVIPGVIPFLDACASAGVRMCVVSSSAQAFLQAGLKSTGLVEYFSQIVSVEDIGSSKREPRVFEYSRELLNTPCSTTWGVDDSLYALETLRNAGFPTIGVCGDLSNASLEESRAICDISVIGLDELTVNGGSIMVRPR